METLPSTIKDAIHATRRLGFHFLWVDRFCIIQDSDIDKKKELAVMSNIYRNAAVTIGAAVGDSSDTGLFIPRDARKYRPCNFDRTIRIDRWTATTTGMSVYGHERREFGPLELRGWIMQEEVLSTRILTFGAQYLSWDCVTMWACESDPVGGSHDFYNKWAHEPNPKGANRISGTEDKSRGFKAWINHTETARDPDFLYKKRTEWYQNENWERWYQVVESYTRRQLTQVEDKLPAISALADFMYRKCTRETLLGLRQKHDASYLAGLWKEDLHCGIHWVVTYTPDTHAQGSIYLAPSWSWASVPAGIVNFLNIRIAMQQKITFLDVKCTPVFGSRSSFGQICSGFMTVRAPCQQAIVKKDFEALKEELNGRIGYPYAIEIAATICTLHSSESGKRIGICSFDNDTISSGILCVLTTIERVRGRPGCLKPKPFRAGIDQTEFECVGLALVPADGAPNCYQRVGLVQTTWDLWYDLEYSEASQENEKYMRTIKII
jgi:Heterokaryon incompatibility protein (HET)